MVDLLYNLGGFLLAWYLTEILFFVAIKIYSPKSYFWSRDRKFMNQFLFCPYLVLKLAKIYQQQPCIASLSK